MMNKVIAAAVMAATMTSPVQAGLKLGQWGVQVVSDGAAFRAMIPQPSGGTFEAFSVIFRTDDCTKPSMQYITKLSEGEPFSGQVDMSVKVRVDRRDIYPVESTGLDITESGMAVADNLIGVDVLQDLMEGGVVRYNLDGNISKFSLSGSAAAIRDAFNQCQGADYFPDIAPGDSDEDYFSL